MHIFALYAPLFIPAEDFDTSSYKVLDYYGYNDMSFYDIENDMEKYRMPQPSSLPK